MPETTLETYAYRILRYTPNLVRDEWMNIGILLYSPQGNMWRLRIINEAEEYRRVRRFHPLADEELLRGLQDSLEAQMPSAPEDLSPFVEKLDQTLSNVLQLSAQRGVLTADVEEELERLYRDHVAPQRWQGATQADLNTPAGIRRRIRDVFGAAGLRDRVDWGVRVEEFTERGDSFRLTCGYRRNGTRGFVHALPLGGDLTQAKVLAFTVERIRRALRETEFAAVTEVEPRLENRRHEFVSNLLREQEIRVVVESRLEEFARELAPTIH